jgi:hypothetical protein
MTSLEGGLGILSCRQKTDIAISVGAGHCAAYASIYKHIKDHNSAHDDPAFGAMENFQEQELSLQLCIGAPMQREELSDSRNRQAAGNQGEQNEDQIWQRPFAARPTDVRLGQRGGHGDGVLPDAAFWGAAAQAIPSFADMA